MNNSHNYLAFSFSFFSSTLTQVTLEVNEKLKRYVTQLSILWYVLQL